MLNNNIAIQRKTLYHQIDSMTTGLPLAPAMANIFMNWWLETATTKSNYYSFLAVATLQKVLQNYPF